jgi:hypothetical protein
MLLPLKSIHFISLVAKHNAGEKYKDGVIRVVVNFFSLCHLLRFSIDIIEWDFYNHEQPSGV